MRKMTEYFKALSDATRLRILQILAREERCVCELMEDLAMNQSAVSHHLRILKHAGLVRDRRDGKWIVYSLDKDMFLRYSRAFAELFGTRGEIVLPVVPKPSAGESRARSCRILEQQKKAANFLVSGE